MVIPKSFISPESESAARRQLRGATRWVVKIGSAVITADGSGVSAQRIAQWAEQIADLRKQGRDIVLVSSGAVAEGCARLGIERPESLHMLQAAAAVGQMGLVQAYEVAFARYQVPTAMVLLTHDDLSNRRRYLNARATLQALLAQGVVPVVNENDTVATDEIRFGDNDTLAALVANLLEAEGLLLLTDQPGMFERDPRRDPTAAMIRAAAADDESLDGMVSSGGSLGRGGMVTKLRASRLAARSGAHTIVADGRGQSVLSDVILGLADNGTLLSATHDPLTARKQWIASHLQTRGELVLDSGAVQVIRNSGRSLLPVGVLAVRGHFERGEAVSCVDEQGREHARGLVNYAADEAAKIIGYSSADITRILGYAGETELVHRDNLVLV